MARRPRALVACAAAALGCAFAATPPALAGPVATSDAAYTVLGAVFPDPLAGCQRAGTSPCDPRARGNAASTTFVGYQEFLNGITYMNTTEKNWRDYLELIVLDGKFGEGSATKAQIEADPTIMAPGNNLKKVEFEPSPEHVTAGLPTSDLGRVKSDLIIVRVTDETVPDKDKKRYTLSLSIHGIERAGAEGGLRAMEQLVTAQSLGEDKNAILPKEIRPGAPTFAEALKKTIIYFTFPNPDGWRRGSVAQGGAFFQRYNGNGVDPNRDYPDIGYSFRGYGTSSEPETRAFIAFHKSKGLKFDAGDDLHGQPFADALSYTLLPHGRHDLGKDTRIRETVKTINRAQYDALKWSPIIQDNDQPVGGGAPCAPGLGAACAKIYAQTWGSVYDTINYTVSGAIGDWFDSRTVGLNADGIDNEMSFSHLDRNVAYERHGEQLHVAGNKAIIFSHVADLADPISGLVETKGKNAFVPNVRLKRAEQRLDPGPPAGTAPQEDIKDQLGNPDPGEGGKATAPFTVERTDKIYSGGMRVDITSANAQGVGSGVAELAVQCRGCDSHVGADESASAADWITVGEDYNQSPVYAQAGLTVAINRPDPFYTDKDGKTQKVEWRALVSQSGGPSGPVRMSVDFTAGSASADGATGGDQPSLLAAYDLANTDFFKDVNPHFADRSKRFQALDVKAVLDGTQKLAGFQNLLLADDLLPGYTGLYKGEAAGEAAPGESLFSAAQKDQWVARLKDYVEGGGNLVLTDGALRAIGELTAVGGDKVARQTVYVGQVSWQDNAGKSTLEDPLAKNVAQPGSRFNSGARRQTFEPTPLGFAIQGKTGGDQSSARQYDIDAAAFKEAGGRIAATSADSGERDAKAVTGRVTVGEFKIGKGTLRVGGALLPQPSAEFDHPLGLEPYALTYTGYVLFCNLIDADCLITRSGIVDDGVIQVPGGGTQAPTACAATAGFTKTAVKPKGRGIAFTLARRVNAGATVDLFAVSRGRRVLKNKRVALFKNQKKSFTYKGSRKLKDGIYFARYRIRAGTVTDTRRHVLELRKGKFRLRPDFYGKASCSIFRTLKLEYPVFGGTRNFPLRLSYRVAQASTVTVTVARGKRVVARYKARKVGVGKTIRLTVPRAKVARRGEYKVTIVARRGSESVKRVLNARAL